MVEAELKAVVREPEQLLERLEQYTPGRPEVYQDTYYDDPEGTLSREDRELRVRTVHGQDDTRSVLTYKGARIDASGSKPEHETRVQDPEAVHALLLGLGYRPSIAFEKRCRTTSSRRPAARCSRHWSGYRSWMGRSSSWRPSCPRKS